MTVITRVANSFERKIKVFSNDQRTTKKTKLGLHDAIKLFPVARIRKDSEDEAYLWCQENIKDNWIWSSPTHTNYAEVYFIHEEDALIFRLKFGSITA